MIGTDLRHYRILRSLGRGGMGEVYLAHDTTLGRDVALKVLRPEVAADQDRRARFEREARAVAALNHPNIVTVHSIEREGPVHFITMEWVSGQPLSAVIPPSGLALSRFFDLSLPLVDAVSAAHERGVTHRDLKPENVMVSDAGTVKVLDFGLAKLKSAGVDEGAETLAASGGHTADGQVIGTFAYMSPEQAEARPLDHRSDIFSLGILLHEMITGRRPFTGSSQASLMAAILRDVPPAVTDLNPSLPPRLAAIIRRCLEKDPGLRYQSAADLKSDLAGLQRDLNSGITTAAAGAAPAQRRMAVRWLAGAAGLAALFALAVWWRPEAPAVDPSVRDAEFTQLTHAEGPELFPTLSPDGRTLVYARAGAGGMDIYSQRVGGENPVNLTPDSGADDTQPAFSPDGERLAFRSDRDGGGIFVMGATGESVRRVSSVGYHPAWSPDGTRLLMVTQNVTDPAFRFTASQLWVVDVATGERTLLTDADASQPHWSPSGHRIAYWGRAAGGAGDVWTIPAAGGTPVPVTTEPSIDWNPVWAPDGRHLYFSSNRGGTMNLWRVAIDERTGQPAGRPQPVTTGAGSASQHLTVSKDGSRIAYVSLVESMNVQKIAFDPASGQAVGAPQWVTRGSRPLAQPDPSPDGARLAFNSSGKQEDIFVAAADGSGLRQLTDDVHKDRAARWSPDGRQIAFYSDQTGQYEIWTIAPDGSARRQLTRSPGAHYPVWSPDGQRMAYSTHAPNGAFIFDTRKPWSEQTPVPLPAIPDPSETFEIWSWSPDGRRLAGQKHLADLSHAGVAMHEIGTDRIDWLTDFGEWPVWLNDSRRLVFSHHGTLHLVDSATRKVEEVMALPQPSLGSVGVSRDNRWIYFTFRSAESDVWLMTQK